MKTFGRSVAIFLIFLAGTLSVIHVDRQCQEMEGGGGPLILDKTMKMIKTME